jgi:hypothetical protein
MGRVPTKQHKCKFCKSSFFSYSEKTHVSLSHRSHRNNNKKCREEQAKLRRAHRDAGNMDEINFDNIVDSDIEIDSGGIEDNNDSIDSDDGLLSERGIVREILEEGKEVDVLFEANFLMLKLLCYHICFLVTKFVFFCYQNLFFVVKLFDFCTLLPNHPDLAKFYPKLVKQERKNQTRSS